MHGPDQSREMEKCDGCMMLPLVRVPSSGAPKPEKASEIQRIKSLLMRIHVNGGHASWRSVK
eukprot:9686339-Alexandrium_andersonii.AAC.1